jgi:hypothetical protein
VIRILCVWLFAAAAIAGETVREPELSPAAARMMRARLRSIRFPRIDFVDSTVREAFEFVFAKSKTLNPEAAIGMSLRLVEFELNDAPPAIPQPAAPEIPGLADGNKVPPGPIVPETFRRITFRAKNVSLEEVLDEICSQAKLRWKLTFYGVSITPLPPKNRTHR